MAAKSTKRLILFVFFLFMGEICLGTRDFAYGASPGEWGPWNKPYKGQVRPSSRSPIYQRLYHSYQRHISNDNGAACPFYPTCSAYALQALQRHGFFYGSLLAIDRLFSEYPGMPNSGLYPFITKYGLHRPYDPVP